MRIYEELFILDRDATDEQVDAAVAQIEEVVKEAGGEIDKVDKWGVRKLGYRIQKRAEGYYVLVQFSVSGTTAIKEIERRFRVDEAVLKFITVRIDEKLKWLEKRKKIREKRAARRPQPTRAPAGASPDAPARPAAPAAPGSPAPQAAAPAKPAAAPAKSASTPAKSASTPAEETAPKAES